jgi:AcrR family transcriptional regulator
MNKANIHPGLILDFAVNLTKEEGISGLSFRSLAKHMGISTFPIVQHFGNKGALILEIKKALYKELQEEVAEVKTKRHYLNLFLGYSLYAWKEPLAHPALAEYLNQELQTLAEEEIIQAMRDSGDFADFSEPEFFRALGRIQIFNHGLADLARRGMLHEPSQEGITLFFCEAVNDLVFGGQHEPFTV